MDSRTSIKRGDPSAFTQQGSYTVIHTSNGQCVDILDGDLATIDVSACNQTVNQEWIVQGGQIVSANTNGNKNAYCLDVYGANFTDGNTLDVAPCNGTVAQEFWLAGQTIGLESVYQDPTTKRHECLDVLGDKESAGATLDESDCNGSNAQWFVLTDEGQITLADNPSLCLAMNGATVQLATCSTGLDFTQLWYSVNQSSNQGGGAELQRSTFVNKSGCLDIHGGVAWTYGTTPVAIDGYTCASSAGPINEAQIWSPFLPYAQPSEPPCGAVNESVCGVNTCTAANTTPSGGICVCVAGTTDQSGACAAPPPPPPPPPCVATNNAYGTWTASVGTIQNAQPFTLTLDYFSGQCGDENGLALRVIELATGNLSQQIPLSGYGAPQPNRTQWVVDNMSLGTGRYSITIGFGSSGGQSGSELAVLTPSVLTVQ
jgi:hypothetical protein